MRKTSLTGTLCLVLIASLLLIASSSADTGAVKAPATQPVEDLAFGPESIPDSWNETVSLTFRDEMGGPGNLRKLSINGQGNATLVRPSGGSTDELVPWGEYQFPLSWDKDELDRLLHFLRGLEIWQLGTIHTTPPMPDEGGFTLEMSASGALLQVRFPRKLVEEMPRLSAIRERMRQLMDVVVGRSSDVPWGELVDGLQVRLRRVKRVWPSGQNPRFMLDIRNSAAQTVDFSRIPAEHCQLQMDHHWYGWAEPVQTDAPFWRLDQGESCEAAFMIDLVNSWAKPARAEEPQFKPGVESFWGQRLKLSPGVHVVRVRFFAPAGKSPVVSNHCLVHVLPPLSAELLARRNELLAQADAKIRRGIIQLAERFPNLKKGKVWDSLLRPSQAGSINILFRRSCQGKVATEKSPFPEEEKFGVLVVIEQPRPEDMQLATSPLYPNLGLVGQVGAGAGAPELDQFLKELITEALEPLAELDTKAAASSPAPQPTEKWGEPVEGVQVRLRAEKKVWKSGEIPIFKAEVRNQGSRDLLVFSIKQTSKLDFDSQLYEHKEISAKSSPFGPGKHYTDIRVSLHNRWRTTRENKGLELVPGKHIIHITVSFIEAKDMRKSIRAISNPVEIEIIPAPQK